MIRPLKCMRRRRGAIAVLTAAIMVALIGMVAFAVDYGYLVKVRTDLQRAADASALAAVQDLIPAVDGTQDLNAAKTSARDFASTNLEDPSFQVADDDIEIGRFDPNTIYSNVTLLNTGPYDAVRVTLRRDGTSNGRVSLFFARVIGVQNAGVSATATAVLQKPQMLKPGADVLPFSIPKDVWDNLPYDEVWSVYADGKLMDENGANIPGNWGTVDLGTTTNSSSDIGDQALNGLRQEDLAHLYADGRIPQDTHIDSSEPLWVNADTGLSAGIKNYIEQIHGQTRLIPIYDYFGGSPNGENLEFHVVGWAVVEVVGSSWNGEKNSHVDCRKMHTFNGELSAKPDLSVDTSIDGAFSWPVLVE